MTIEGFERVQEDVVTGLSGIFTPRDDEAFKVHPDFVEVEVLGAEGIQVVPWVYTCLHTGTQVGLPEGSGLEGLFTTDRVIEVHGVTVINTRRDVVMRYVDWLGVITQLGLQVSWRVPVDEEVYNTNLGFVSP